MRMTNTISTLAIPTRAPRRAGVPSATAFVARVILAGLAAAMGVALIAAAPRTVTIPIAVVLGAGLVASGLVVAADRWLTRDRRGPTRPHGGTGSHERSGEPSDVVRVASRAGAPSRASCWGTLAAVSVSLLVLALIVPEPIGVVLAAAGLALLLVVRIAASLAGWLPRGAVRVRA